MRNLAFALLFIAPSFADTSGFSAGANGAVVHTSGYVCPERIGSFQRDTTGWRDPKSDADYCAYSALSGVYGTVVIMPLPSPFDPKAALAREFRVEEGMRRPVTGEDVRQIGSLAVYTRSYETARLEQRQYRTIYASAGLGAWVVTAIVEYAYPQDKDLSTAFLTAAYGEAVRTLSPAKH